jgi:hypothetical protein
VRGPLLWIDTYNFTAGTVDDAGAAVIASRSHTVADGERPLAGHEFFLAEPTVPLHPRVGQRVELGDVAASVGDHHRVLLAGSRGLPPVIDERGARSSGAVGRATMRPRAASAPARPPTLNRRWLVVAGRGLTTASASLRGF